MTERRTARRMAADAIEAGTPLAWFEELYALSDGDPSVIPWADMTVNPNLDSWLQREQVDGTDRTALVVGCGAGDDAEALAARGFAVTAFDISPTCIDWCEKRYPSSAVEYVTADLFESPVEWKDRFDFVFEAYTLQVLPSDLRAKAIRLIAKLVAPAGTVFIITRGRDDGDEPGQMPWPLLRSELNLFVECGLTEKSCEDYLDNEDPPVRRFRIQYQRVAEHE